MEVTNTMVKKIKNLEYVANNSKGEKVTESLSEVLGNLLLIIAQENKLKGIKELKKYNKFSKIIQSAKATGFIELEDGDFKELKSLVEENAPAVWGMNAKLTEMLEEFLKA